MDFRKKLRLLLNGYIGPLPRPERWVFLVGCYNSGTTLLHDVLATHPHIGSMVWEGQFFTDQLPLPKALGLPRLWALAPERFRLREGEGEGVNTARLKRQWGAQYNDPHRPILLEKSPTNAGRTRWLQQHFPGAHFIGIVRNGYAVAEGIHRKAGHPLETAAEQWRVSNEIMFEDFEHLERKILVRYEDLTESFDTSMSEIARFLGLEGSYFGAKERSWKIHEQTSSVRNMNPRSLASLSSDDVERIHAVAGPLLERLGYTASEGAPTAPATPRPSA